MEAVIDGGVALFIKHRPGLIEALKRGHDERDILDVQQALIDGRAQAWGDADCFIVTRLLPNTLVVELWLATGEHDACVELSEQIFEWARGHGYRYATFTGRRGWGRTLKKHGWEELTVTMGKVL